MKTLDFVKFKSNLSNFYENLLNKSTNWKSEQLVRLSKQISLQWKGFQREIDLLSQVFSGKPVLCEKQVNKNTKNRQEKLKKREIQNVAEPFEMNCEENDHEMLMNSYDAPDLGCETTYETFTNQNLENIKYKRKKLQKNEKFPILPYILVSLRKQISDLIKSEAIERGREIDHEDIDIPVNEDINFSANSWSINNIDLFSRNSTFESASTKQKSNSNIETNTNKKGIDFQLDNISTDFISFNRKYSNLAKDIKTDAFCKLIELAGDQKIEIHQDLCYGEISFSRKI